MKKINTDISIGTRQAPQRVLPCLNSLAILMIASLAWSNSAIANDVNLSTNSDYLNETESVDIYVPPPEQGNYRVCEVLLRPTINSIIEKNTGKWGILVEKLEDRTVIYNYNADKYLIPASNMKIITTAAALQRLDPEAPIRSTSVRNWVTITNQRSNNAYADTLLRYIGGPTAAKTALAQMGINPSWIRQADGSGISRNNVATPRAFVEILRAMYYSPKREVFHASLPIAGLSGTLKNRMRATPAQGTVYAKTGTLTGVRALSGYIHHPHYGILVFSIIANNPKQSGKALVKAIDQIVLQLSLVTPCEL